MTVTIKIGHVLDKLAEIPTGSIHGVWTSIPYWGLRSYGTEPQIWGGASDCSHEWGDELLKPRNGAGRHGKTSQFIRQSRAVTDAQVSGSQAAKGRFCIHCGAWRGEHGLEPTLDMWLTHEVIIWRGIRRVLRSDGVAWLNCGDAYATSSNGRSAADTKAAGNDDRTFRDKPISTAVRANRGNNGGDGVRGGNGTTEWKKHGTGLVSKQRLMLPARLVLALQQDGAADAAAMRAIQRAMDDLIDAYDGAAIPDKVVSVLEKLHAEYADAKGTSWWLRDEIVWFKLNPMPSSVNDRTTPAHEMLYMLTKSARYYFDAVAIMEPASKESHPRAARGRSDSHKWADGGPGDQTIAKKSPVAGRAMTGVAPKAALIEGTGKGHPKSNASFNAALGTADLVTFRNKRSVWPLVTEPFSNPHFATAPTSIVEPCILAGTSEKGCCPTCLAPWKRIVRRRAMISKPGPSAEAARASTGSQTQGRKILSSTMVEPPSIETLGWYPTCQCYVVPPLPKYEPKPEDDVDLPAWEARCDEIDAARRRICEAIADCPVQACIVLDPFGGSGTTALVADRNGRDGMLIELNPDYAQMSVERVKDDAPLLTTVVAA